MSHCSPPSNMPWLMQDKEKPRSWQERQPCRFDTYQTATLSLPSRRGCVCVCVAPDYNKGSTIQHMAALSCQSNWGERIWWLMSLVTKPESHQMGYGNGQSYDVCSVGHARSKATSVIWTFRASADCMCSLSLSSKLGKCECSNACIGVNRQSSPP